MITRDMAGRLGLSLMLSWGLGCSDEVVGTVTPAISVTPGQVDLGATPLGGLMKHTVEVRSVGSAVLTVSGVTLAGRDGAPPSEDLALSVMDALPKSLAPQQVLVLEVQHLPRDNLLDSGVLRIASDDPNTAVVEVPIIQTIAGAPQVAGVPDLEAAKVEANTPSGVRTFVEAVPLGQVAVGLRKSATLYLVNVGSGNVPLDLTRARLVNANAEVTVMLDPLLPASVPALGAAGVRPGTTVGVRVDVSWAPTRAGQVLMETLRVESNDPTRPTLDILITGNTELLDPPMMRVEPTAGLDFGTVQVGMSAQRGFTIFNDGASDLPILPITLSSSAAFTFATTPSAMSIPAGGMRMFTVNYRPLATGADAATAHISSSHPAITAVDYPLSGMGNETMACVPTTPDPREPSNDACASASDRGAVLLNGNTEGISTVNDGAIESMADNDWNRFVMEVDIGCDFVVGYEIRANVQLGVGESAEVCLRVGDCATPARQACGQGSVRTTWIAGANGLCQSTGNAVPVFVQVRHTGGEPTCQPYTLTFGAR